MEIAIFTIAHKFVKSNLSKYSTLYSTRIHFSTIMTIPTILAIVKASFEKFELNIKVVRSPVLDY